VVEEGSDRVPGFLLDTNRRISNVRSLLLVSTYARPDALWRSQLEFWRWLAEVAPSERAFLEGFFTRPRLLDHISRGVRP
jgi:hypothetical protein